MKRRDLTTGSEREHLLYLAMPMIWGLLAIMSMHLVDTYFVGQLGSDELAAMSFTFPVITILSSLAFGVGAGASSAIARAIGAANDHDISRYSTQSIIIAACLAGIFAVVGLNSVDRVFTLLGAESSLLGLIHDYIDIWYLGCVLVVVPMVGNAGIRAAGNTRLPSMVMILVSLVNIILDPLLIFGWWGIPKMGLQGAALASVIAYSIAFSVALYVLIVRLRFITWSGCCQQVWSSWQAILRIGLPAAGTNLISPLSIAITTWMVARYGNEAVAGFGVASRLESICLVVLIAVASVMGPFSGQNWGARKRQRLAYGLRLSYQFSLVWGVLAAMVLWWSADTVVAAFSDDSAVQHNAVIYLSIVPVTYAFLGMVMITSSFANGIGNPVPALVLTLMRLLIVYLPLVWLFGVFWGGVISIYMASAVANVVVGIGALWWATRYSRKG